MESVHLSNVWSWMTRQKNRAWKKSQMKSSIKFIDLKNGFHSRMFYTEK
jgi:hypothetical protein